jgi:hypothetical protein
MAPPPGAVPGARAPAAVAPAGGWRPPPPGVGWPGYRPPVVRPGWGGWGWGGGWYGPSVAIGFGWPVWGGWPGNAWAFAVPYAVPVPVYTAVPVPQPITYVEQPQAAQVSTQPRTAPGLPSAPAVPAVPAAPGTPAAPGAAAQRAPEVLWNYCTDPPGYYPYVQTCNATWIAVRPQDVPPPRDAAAGDGAGVR